MKQNLCELSETFVHLVVKKNHKAQKEKEELYCNN